MTRSEHCSYCRFIGVYVTLNDVGNVIQEQVGFGTIGEFWTWVSVMRDTYPDANFALYQIEQVTLIATD